MRNDKTALIEEFLSEFDKLSPDDKRVMLAFMKLIKGEIPSDPRMILRLNRDAIKMQEQGYSVPAGLMPMLAGLALNIIDGVHGISSKAEMRDYVSRTLLNDTFPTGLNGVTGEGKNTMF